ncbi:MAG: hypothetical protein EOO77_03105 [Oxalobacteraceae bacterium]|nr:MAG: hypothetical protein EOO77_03105 [Oxalobacteraceae bacterium]
MEQRITHACGHEQDHYLTGYDSQQERKARWLQTTMCWDCFVTEKKAEEVRAAALNNAAIAHLDLPVLVGTDRQMSWASTIRTKRLAVMTAPGGVADHDACLRVSDAKWWIDHRDLPDLDMIAAAARLPR